MWETQVQSLGQEDPLGKEMATQFSTLLPGKSYGQRRLVGYSPWVHKESDMTERLTLSFFLSLLGLGKWNPNHWVTKQDVKEISKRLILLLFTFYLFFFFWEGENSAKEADLVCALNHRDVSKQKWWMGILAAAEMWRWSRLKNLSHGSKRVKTFYFTRARLEWSPGGTDESKNLAWSHLKGDLNDVLWTFFFVNKKPLKFSEAIWKQFVGNKRLHITFGVESCQNMISSFPLRMEEAFLSLQRKQAWRERDE